jgi:hypothetical protein
LVEAEDYEKARWSEGVELPSAFTTKPRLRPGQPFDLL